MPPTPVYTLSAPLFIFFFFCVDSPAIASLKMSTIQILLVGKQVNSLTSNTEEQSIFVF